MFGMFKAMFMVVIFIGIAWFGSTVELGERTLFGHLRAIGSSKESQQLVDGTKQSAKPLVDDVRRRIAGDVVPAVPSKNPAVAGAPDAGLPQETVTAGERRQLRRIIGAADKTASAHR